MNYHQYYPVDVVNGPGTRCTLFVAGCEHKCRGCYNATTWRVDSGKPFDQQLEDRIISDLNDSRIVRQGLSLTGGDPLHPHNLSTILHLVKRVRQETEHKDIWLWTGYSLSELSAAQRRVIDEINTLIDGKFIQELKDPSLLWRGSSNQEIHYLRPA
ncbi:MULTISPECIES: anaerobic ribonucleoside-triphosphate reductase-activating protein [Snodgrassella]|uniref:Anaerobic ribonucleoside-triphosphate reductase-activating protein n=1 Tax=Snodgrassella alvi TaxID=1196083 RepID=A0A2N9WU79_9NEIS|nr:MULTISPECIES: anaerobic ribonucleoside-triphosphate reductase-activating protein [Snodgrassella]NUE66019.1 anaerobic ribonucleoside-triphosphate reductase-activating protein [Snodgrassella sp. ESL0253]PIT15592.1 anaerobic ribonucleotide reductase-activating protein [Snodgrassella alvi]